MAAVTPENEVVIARQYRHGIGRISLRLPGGLLEPTEDPILAAQRELREETGFVSNQWESLGHFVPDSNYRCGQAHLFLAREAKKVAEADAEDLEEMEIIRMPLAQVVQELRDGNVVSLRGAAAIALAAARLRR
jgi:ADP-ribose pyrophosphatase